MSAPLPSVCSRLFSFWTFELPLKSWRRSPSPTFFTKSSAFFLDVANLTALRLHGFGKFSS